MDLADSLAYGLFSELFFWSQNIFRNLRLWVLKGDPDFGKFPICGFRVKVLIYGLHPGFQLREVPVENRWAYHAGVSQNYEVIGPNHREPNGKENGT